MEYIMKVFVLFKWTDFMGVFSSYEKCLEVITENEPNKRYWYRFSIMETNVDSNDWTESKAGEGGITVYIE